MSSLSRLIPSIIEAAATTANQEDSQDSKEGGLPPQIKLRLHTIFSQIENEFNSLYVENIRLHQELVRSDSK